MNKKMVVLTLVLGLLAALGLPAAQGQSFNQNAGAFSGRSDVQQFAQWSAKSISAISSGASSVTMDTCFFPLQGISTNWFPLAVGVVVQVQDPAGNSELVTVTGVSAPTLSVGSAFSQGWSCGFSATFANAHSGVVKLSSGDFGLGEAIYNMRKTGGFVTLTPGWGGTDATVSGMTILYPNVGIEDISQGPPRFWNLQGGLTTLAAPTTLTAVTALPSATPVGAFGTGTYHMCIAYVDIMGQEGPCSADFSEAGLATGSFIFSAPAASTGAIGYTIYIGLTGGGVTNLNYKVPLTSSICTLTTIETTTAACAVANTTYGQAGATATVTAITVNTSPIQPAVTVVSTTAIYVPNAGGRTTYGYVPGSHIGYAGLPGAFLPYTISAADATTVPSVLGTVNLPPGLMNVVGRTLEVCGKATTTASTATIGSIQFQWDAFGQNTAGKGVQIGNLGLTPATAFATTAVYTFCEDFETTVAGATATAGSINTIGGFLNTSGVATAAAGQGASSDPTIGATASLNLAAEARLNVAYVHTTGTDGAALTLQSLTVKVLN
jgi:hypothetical protein